MKKKAKELKQFKRIFNEISKIVFNLPSHGLIGTISHKTLNISDKIAKHKTI